MIKTMNLRSKLFLMIAGIIGLLFIMQMFFQSFWLETFYIHQLSKTIETQLIKVDTSLENIDMQDTASVKKTLETFRSQSDYPIHIASASENRYVTSVSTRDEAFIIFQPESTKTAVTIPVDNTVIQRLDQASPKPNNTNTNVRISGYINEVDSEVIPLEIELIDAQALEGGQAKDSIDYIEIQKPDEIYIDANPIEDVVNDDNWTYINTDGSMLYYQVQSNIGATYSYSESILLNKIKELVASGALSDIDTYNVSTIHTYDDYNKKNNVILFKKLNQADQDFFAFSIVSYASMEKPLSIYQQFNWIILIVVMGVAFILTFLFTGRMVAPIQSMESVSMEMAQLNFEKRVSVKSKDEIGRLAESFNTLADQLQISTTEMQDLNKALEKEVKQRIEQEEMLKAFISNASHELKTPVTILKGLVEGAQDGVYNANTKDHQDLLQSEIDRMEKMIFDLIQISKIERNAQVMNPSIFDPSDLIYSTYQRYKSSCLKKDISFTFDMDDSFVKADAGLIESVFENIIGNAIMYTAQGGNIECKVKSNNERVNISIENTKAHIPENELKKIFDPFYRVDKSHTRQTGGSGLGLSIVKNILELHDADYRLENTNEGVVFTFTLDLIQEESIQTRET